MNLIKRILIRIFLGKEKTETFEVGGAKATITDEDGQTFTITRHGYAQRLWNGTLTMSGMALLKEYMSGSKRSVLIADVGMVPVCRIKRIEIEEFPYQDSVTYYE